jgi:hypothetical protein
LIESALPHRRFRLPRNHCIWRWHKLNFFAMSVYSFQLFGRLIYRSRFSKLGIGRRDGNDWHSTHTFANRIFGCISHIVLFLIGSLDV